MMASISPINDRRGVSGRTAGFTLAEVMMVTVISSFVFAGVLSAYIFLGRGLVREGNAESLESKSRLALYYLTQDVGAAISVTTAATSNLVLVVATSPSSSFTSTYTYSSSTGNLTRSTSTGASLVVLSGITSFSFYYYDTSQSIPSPTPSGTTWVKQISMQYSTAAGLAVSGAESKYSMLSPPIVLKNKTVLQ
jgi:Tfp pilus assembly protein PilW